MSVSHLDAIKKKYGFQTLNVATWRDPNLSVHPARGGPKGPTISPDLAAKPFELTYKVRIKPPPPPPEPTDDEQSGGDEEAISESAAPVDSPIEQSPPEPQAPSNHLEITDAGPPPETTPEPTEQSPPAETVPVESIPPEISPEAAFPAPAEVLDDQLGTNEVAGGDNIDSAAPVDTTTPNEAPAVDDIQAPPPAPDPPQVALDPDEIVEIVEGTPGSFPAAEEETPQLDAPSTLEDTSTPEDSAIEVPPPAPEPPSAPTEDLGPNEVITVEEPAAPGEKSPKIVQFATGTPDPKPTHRKKKMAKGSKNKKKKTTVDVSGKGSPDDIVAIEEPAPVQTESIVEVPFEVPDAAGEAMEPANASGEHSTVAEPILDEVPSAEEPIPEPPTIEKSVDALDQAAIAEIVAPVIIEEAPPAKGKSKKKKGSSKSTKDAPLLPPSETLPLEDPVALDDPAPAEDSTPSENPLPSEASESIAVDAAPEIAAPPSENPESIIVEALPEPAAVEVPKAKSKDKKKKKSKGKSKGAESPPVITIPAGLGIDLSDILPDETPSEPFLDDPAGEAKVDVSSSAEGLPQTETMELKQEEGEVIQPIEESEPPAAGDEPSSADQGLALSGSVAEDNPAEPKAEATTSNKSDVDTHADEPASPEPDVTTDSVEQPSEAVQVVVDEESPNDATMSAPYEDEGALSPDEDEHIEESTRSDSAVDVDSWKGSVDDVDVDGLDEGTVADQPDELDAWDEQLSDSESEEGSVDEAEVELDAAGDSIDLADEDDESSPGSLQEPGAIVEETLEQDDETEAKPDGTVEVSLEDVAAPEPLKVDPEADRPDVIDEVSPGIDDKQVEEVTPVPDAALAEEPALDEPQLEEEFAADSGSDSEDEAPGSDGVPEESEVKDPAEAESNKDDPVEEVPPEDDPKDDAPASSEAAVEVAAEEALDEGSRLASDETTEVLDDSGEGNDAVGETVAEEVTEGNNPDDIIISDDAKVPNETPEQAPQPDDQEQAAEPPVEGTSAEVVEESTPDVAVIAAEIEDAPLEKSTDAPQSPVLEASEGGSGEPAEMNGGNLAAEEASAPPDVPGEQDIVDPSPQPETTPAEAVSEPELAPSEPVPEVSAAEPSIPEEPPLVETIVVEPAKKEEPSQDAPPSPQLSRSSGSKHKAEHWKREHKKRSSSDSKKSSDKSRSSKPVRLPDGLRSTRDRSHRSSLMTAEELAARARRREERKALEIARIQEEERRIADEEELRRIRHEARRAARKAAAEEATRIAKEEAEAIARKEAERRRRHREVREIDRPRPRRESKSSSSSIPKLLGFSLGQSSVRTSNHHVKSAFRVGDDERPGTSTSSKDVLRDEVPRTESPTLPGSGSHGSREGGSSGHHRRHRHHRSESDRPEPRRRESERHDSGRSDEKRRRRPAAPEQKPKSFLGRLFA